MALFDVINYLIVRIGRTYIRQSPRNTTAMEGTRVTLSCRAEASLKNITYQWYRGDVNVQLMSGLYHRDDDDDDDANEMKNRKSKKKKKKLKGITRGEK